MYPSNSEATFFKKASQEDLLSFCVFNDLFFTIQPHHRLIADALERIENGSLKRLRIEMPPRSGKSRMVQEFVAWMYGRNPRRDVIYTGHSVGLLQGFSRNIRNRIQSSQYANVFDTRVASDSSAVNNWNVHNGGEFAVYGVG